MTLTVTKADVAAIIVAWWEDFEANPESYSQGPDYDGMTSADLFFKFAKKTNSGKNLFFEFAKKTNSGKITP